MPKTASHLTEIDYLRGMAIFLTLLAHFAALQPIPSPFYIFIITNIAQFWGGVILFFTISGFVISRSFMDNFSRSNAPTKDDFRIACKIFYLRRCYRIVPTAFFWIIITVLLAINFNKFGSFGSIKSIIVQALAAIFFIYNLLTPWIAGPALAIYWSLSFEEQFYLLFPFLSRLSTNVKLFITLFIIILFFQIHRPADQSRLITSFPLDAICYGVLITLIHQSKFAHKIRPSFLSNSKYCNLNLLISVSIMIFSPVLLKNITYGTSILVLSGAWLVFCASYDSRFIKPPRLISKKLRLLGTVSFSLYCCHMPCYLLAKEIALHYKQLYNLGSFTINVVSLIMAIFLCSIFTFLSVKLIEKPSRNYGRYKTKLIKLQYAHPV